MIEVILAMSLAGLSLALSAQMTQALQQRTEHLSALIRAQIRMSNQIAGLSGCDLAGNCTNSTPDAYLLIPSELGCTLEANPLGFEESEIHPPAQTVILCQ